MEIKDAYPPNIEEIKKIFPIKDGYVFTYGDILYAPNCGKIGPELMRHEETHSIQQKSIGVEKWWGKYLVDKDFRFSQELEAYRNQYREGCKYTKDRNTLSMFLFALARDLSGEMYGNMVSFGEAQIKIKQ